MKYTLLLILTLAMVPAATAQQQYRENVYVFSVDYGSYVDATEECVVALAKLERRLMVGGIQPSAGGRFKINSVSVSSKRGKVSDAAVEEIGEMLLCEDHETNPPEMNLIPVYFEITIGNKTFKIEGGGTHPAFPDTLVGGISQYTPPGYPTPERSIYNYSGTVLPSIPGTRGGSFTGSILTAGSDEFDDGLGLNSVQVLRVLLPVNP